MDSAVSGKRAKKKPRGKPFAKGGDPRMNTAGNMNAAAQSWALMLRNTVAERLTPSDAADVLVEAYRRKWPWAIREVHGLLVPELPKAVEHSGEIKTENKLVVEVVQVKART